MSCHCLLLRCIEQGLSQRGRRFNVDGQLLSAWGRARPEPYKRHRYCISDLLDKVPSWHGMACQFCDRWRCTWVEAAALCAGKKAAEDLSRPPCFRPITGTNIEQTPEQMKSRFSPRRLRCSHRLRLETTVTSGHEKRMFHQSQLEEYRVYPLFPWTGMLDFETGLPCGLQGDPPFCLPTCQPTQRGAARDTESVQASADAL